MSKFSWCDCKLVRLFALKCFAWFFPLNKKKHLNLVLQYWYLSVIVYCTHCLKWKVNLSVWEKIQCVWKCPLLFRQAAYFWSVSCVILCFYLSECTLFLNCFLHFADCCKPSTYWWLLGNFSSGLIMNKCIF